MAVSGLIENNHQSVLWPHDVMGFALLTTRLVPSGKKWPVDVAQVVCHLVPVSDVWRLTDPDRFFDLSD